MILYYEQYLFYLGVDYLFGLVQFLLTNFLYLSQHSKSSLTFLTTFCIQYKSDQRSSAFVWAKIA